VPVTAEFLSIARRWRARSLVLELHVGYLFSCFRPSDDSEASGIPDEKEKYRPAKRGLKKLAIKSVSAIVFTEIFNFNLVKATDVFPAPSN
jgi:hypothetical protein